MSDFSPIFGIHDKRETDNTVIEIVKGKKYAVKENEYQVHFQDGTISWVKRKDITTEAIDMFYNIQHLISNNVSLTSVLVRTLLNITSTTAGQRNSLLFGGIIF